MRHAFAAFVALVFVPSSAVAQRPGFRAGIGAAAAGATGVNGLVGIEMRRERLLLRVEGEGVITGRSAAYSKTARTVSVGGAAGLSFNEGRRYAAIAVGAGLDVRESDRFTSVGFAAGGTLTQQRRLFYELRFAHWAQTGPRHFTLPANMVALVFGLTM